MIGVGDLIEGYMDPKDHTPATVETYREWWEEWDGFLEALEAPFFYVPGNHDLNNPPSVEVWKERFGGTRQYSHFRYKDTLFLIVSTEDPPKDTDALLETDPEYAAEIDRAYNAAKKAAHEGAPLDHIIELLTPVEEFAGKINISDEQVDYFRTVLADNQDVRWTFVLMHSPAWWTQTGYEIDPGNFTVIEEELSDRVRVRVHDPEAEDVDEVPAARLRDVEQRLRRHVRMRLLHQHRFCWGSDLFYLSWRAGIRPGSHLQAFRGSVLLWDWIPDCQILQRRFRSRGQMGPAQCPGDAAAAWLRGTGTGTLLRPTGTVSDAGR